MDKQLVEEMAMNRYKKHILFSERKKLSDEYEEWVNKPLEDGSKIKDCALSVITFMTSKGYRKIPEDAVVLTGMETEQRFEDLMVAFDEMGFMPNTTHPFPEEYVETWKQRLIFVFGQLRKETAEKFAEMAKEGAFTDFMGEPIIRASKIDEICKEITEGKDDATSRSI